MYLLIIEDEPKTTAYLTKGLTEAGFTVEIAHDGEEGLSLVHAGNYDLVILDVMLPRRNGWSVIAEMRRTGTDVPVLFLTARDAIQDRVRGLELGADDYLVKPFAFSELLARVRTLLRRGQERRPETIRVNDLIVDLFGHKAHRAGNLIELTPQEFRLLSLLASRRGEVLPRTLIAERVWGMHFDPGTNVIDVAIRRLRSKVDNPDQPRLIHTVRGVGYVLEER